MFCRSLSHFRMDGVLRLLMQSFDLLFDVLIVLRWSYSFEKFCYFFFCCAALRDQIVGDDFGLAAHFFFFLSARRMSFFFVNNLILHIGRRRTLCNLTIRLVVMYAIDGAKIDESISLVHFGGRWRRRVREGNIVTAVVMAPINHIFGCVGHVSMIELVLRLPDRRIMRIVKIHLLELRFFPDDRLLGALARAVRSNSEVLLDRFVYNWPLRLRRELLIAANVVIREERLLLFVHIVSEVGMDEEYGR